MASDKIFHLNITKYFRHIENYKNGITRAGMYPPHA